jgi:TatD DNase family protein
MKWIDTHSHIYQDDFDGDIEDVIKNANEAGIYKIFLPNVDTNSIERMHKLSDRFPSVCHPMMGLHPTSVNSSYEKELKFIRSHFNTRKYIAVGEIGLDLYWDKTRLKEQIAAFEEQLRWSIDLGLPVVIHNREAFPYVMDSLHRVGIKDLNGVFHSFGGSREEIGSVLDLPGFMVGINGVTTFKKAAFSEYLAEEVPLDRIILETDSPYLAPVPYRGKRNEPVYMLKTAEKLSQLYDLSMEELSWQTTANALRLFGC